MLVFVEGILLLVVLLISNGEAFKFYLTEFNLYRSSYIVERLHMLAYIFSRIANKNISLVWFPYAQNPIVS